MRKIFFSWRVLILVAIATLLLGTTVCLDNAVALDWPTRDITISVPYTPGGGFDLLGRGIARFIPKYLPKKVNVIVKNNPGAGKKIAFKELLTVPPDGHTIAVVEIGNVEILRIAGQLETMDVTSLMYLGRMTQLPDMVVLSTNSPYKKPADMKGKTLRFVNYDAPTMLRAIIIARALGVTPTFVMYDAGTEGFLALMRGDIDVNIINWVASMRMMKAYEGKMFPMFVSSTIPGLNVPSGKDLGLVYDENAVGYGHSLVTGPGVSSEILGIWEEVLNKVFSDPEWHAHMKKLEYPSMDTLTGEKMRKFAASLKAIYERHKDDIHDMYTGKYERR